MMATLTRSLVAVVILMASTAMLLPAQVAGEEAVSILGMAWTEQPAPALVVSASGPVSFLEARNDAGILLLDLAQATPAGSIESVAEPAAGLRSAELQVVEEAGRRFTRLKVEAAPGFRLVASALPAGVEVRLDRAEPSGRPAVAGGFLSDLLPVADASGVSVLLAGDGPLSGRTFVLDGPPRVVLDIPGVVSQVSRRVHPVEAAGVRRIRISQFATSPEPIVRVVADLDSPLPYSYEATDRGGVLRVGHEPSAPGMMASAPLSEASGIEEASVAPAGEPGLEVATAAAEDELAGLFAQIVAEDAAAEEQVAPPSPVEIVDVPVPTDADLVGTHSVTEEDVASMAEPPAVTVASVASQAPVQSAAVEEVPVAAEWGDTSLTEPPIAVASSQEPEAQAPPDSPWTTTPTALVEQAPEPTRVVGGAREVETEERRFTGELISLEFRGADIRDVLRAFAKITGLNIVVDPDVGGVVTVNLENVPWDQCLDIILRINKLDYVVENNVLRVARLTTLTAEKASMKVYRESAEDAAPMRTVTKILSYAKATAVAGLLTGRGGDEGFFLSRRGTVIVDERTNQLIIRDSATRIEGVLNLIDSLDTPNPQVTIEARIVETTRDFSRALGVTWGYMASADAEHGTSTGWRFPNEIVSTGGVNLGGAVGTEGYLAFTFGDILDAFNLDFVLSAAESKGLVKFVSSPKITAQNNEAAMIQSGYRIPYQVVANNTVTIVFDEATLRLNVTPQITPEGTVILDIDVRKRDPTNIQPEFAARAPIQIRDAQTRLMVRDGGTTVIGGIYKFQDTDNVNAVPGLSKIPVLGNLFRNKETRSFHEELLVFITPRILKY